VHSSAITASGLNSLNEGDELVFEVAETPKGLSAINLKNA
jgi:cold shock CspA family protein